MPDPTLTALRRKLEKRELEHLRRHVAELGERLEYAVEECTRARECAESWREDAMELIDELQDEGKTIGLTVAGQIGVVAEAPEPAPAYITVPETTLPGGRVVPAFRVSTYLCSRGAGDVAVSSATGAPWVSIDYNTKRQACARAGGQLITETQALALAWDVYQQDINWTGGKVGEGSLFQGLRKGSVDKAMPASYEPDDPDERRWHQLSNGERIYDLAGNAFTQIFDDVQGDENGLTTVIQADSISLTTAPYPSLERGVGWRPVGKCDWSGNALVRGGCWVSESNAGVFRLGYGWPGGRSDRVGFRCTQP